MLFTMPPPFREAPGVRGSYNGEKPDGSEQFVYLFT